VCTLLYLATKFLVVFESDVLVEPSINLVMIVYCGIIVEVVIVVVIAEVEGKIRRPIL